MKKFIGYFYDLEDGEIVDDFKEWTKAESKQEAERYFINEHRRRIDNGTCKLYMVCEEN